MADDDKQSNIGVAAAAPPEPDAEEPGKKRSASLFSGGPATLNYGEKFAGKSAWIESMVVDGKPLEGSRGAKVSPGSEIIILGGGLSKDNVDVWEIKQSGRLTPDPFTDWIARGDRVVLNLSRVLGGVAEGSFEIYVFSTKHGGGVRKLPVKFIYQKEEEPKDSKAAGGKDDSDKTGARPRAGAGGGVDLGGGLMDTFKQAAQTAVTEPAKQFVEGLEDGKKSVQAQQKTVQTSAPGPDSSAAAKAKAEAEADFDAGEVEGGAGEVETSVRAQAPAVPETVRQSAELIGEYIDKNPETIAHVQTREKVLSALKSGDLSGLNAEGRASLQSTLKTIAGLPGGSVSTQLRSAAQMVSDASANARARVETAGSAKAEVGVESSAKSEAGGGEGAQVETEVKSGAEIESSVKAKSATGGKIQSGAQSAGEAEVESSTRTKAALGGEASAGKQAGAGANLKQSAEEVGEYLYKNPQLIPDTSARNRILEALATGKVGSLPGDDRRLLINALQKIVQDPKQLASLRQASQITADSAQGSTLPGEGGVKPESASEPLAAPESEPSAPEEAPIQPAEPQRAKEAPAYEEAKKAEALNLPHKEEYKQQVAAMHGRDKAMDAVLGRPSAPAAAGQPLGKELPAKDKVRDSAPLGGGLPGEEKKSPTAPSEREGLGLPKQDAGKPEAGGGKAAAPGLPSRPGAEKQKEEEGKGPKRQPESVPEKDKDQEDEDAGSDQAKNIEQAQRILQDERGVKSFNVKEAESILNKELSMLLNRAVIAVWLSAIPSFGTSILLGAILGDIIWILGPKVVASTSRLASWAAAKIPGLSKGVREKFNIESVKLELSWSVKANIIVLNLTFAVLVSVIAAIILSIIWGVCNKQVSYLTKEAIGLQPYCESFNQNFVGRAVNYVATGSAGFEPSNNTPGNLINTQKWTEAINNAAQKYNIDACILRVVVQAESSGRENAVGCHCAFNGRPALCTPFNASLPPLYGLNWKACGHDIGLTQIAIYPEGSQESYKRWCDPSKPTRLIANACYSPTDLLNPLTALDVTAHVFRDNLAKARGDVAGAFAAYAGQSAYTQTFVNQRMALYNLCIGQR